MGMGRFLSFFAIAILFCASAHGRIERIVCDSDSQVQRTAVADLRAKLAFVEGSVAELVKSGDFGDRSVIVGKVSDSALLKKYAGEVKKLTEGGYLVRADKIDGKSCIVVAAKDDEGVANGIYALLSQMGYGFTLGTQFTPQKLNYKIKPVAASPKLHIRGFLPWYNFFNSPTVWDEPDHRAFADDAIALGANFIGFHNYNMEPLCGYIGDDNKPVKAARLLSTKSPTWGTHPLKADDFGFGTNKIFADEYFGAKTTLIKDSNEAILKEQDLVAKMLAYADNRGIIACIGFEVGEHVQTPIPTDARDMEIFVKRLRHTIEKYPNAKYLWLWLPEAAGLAGVSTGIEAGTPKNAIFALENYAKQELETYKLIGDTNPAIAWHHFYDKGERGKLSRTMRAVSLEQYAKVALKILAQYENPPKLVMSGWGGDTYLAADLYYDGLNKTLPQEVVFSALEHITPRPKVSDVYGTFGKRERWPIPWLENDGDQWQPQPWVKTFEGTMRDLFAKNCTGVLAIHWRTRCVGEAFQYLCDAAWKGDLSLDDFFADYSKRLYGGENLEQMAKIHRELDALPYRWLGGRGQKECATFAWDEVGSEEDLRKLLQIKSEIEKLKFKNPSALENVGWLLTRIDWTLLYRQMTVCANSAQKAMSGGNFEVAVKFLDNPCFAEAFRTYARRVTTRGEYGVLATANTKAYVDWLKMRSECEKALGKSFPPKFGDWTIPQGERFVRVPRRITSIEAGRDFELEPIVFGGGKAWIFYRKLGEKTWSKKELGDKKHWVKYVKIPAEEIGEVGLEYAFSLGENPRSLERNLLAVMPEVKLAKRVKKELKFANKKIEASCKAGEGSPILLTWREVENADYYKVFRDGELVCATTFAHLPDLSQKSEGFYTVEAYNNNIKIAESEKIKYRMPNIPISEKAELCAGWNPSGILIRVAAPKSDSAVKCRIYKSGRRAEIKRTQNEIFEHIEKSQKLDVAEHVIAEIAVNKSQDFFQHFDESEAGAWKYRAVFLNAHNVESEKFSEVSLSYEKSENKPICELSLSEKPEGAREVGSVKYTQDGAEFESGYLVLDNVKPKFGAGLKISFEMNVPEGSVPDGVLLSFGIYGQNGLYFQGGERGLNAWGSRELKTRAGGLSGGKWRKVEFEYDCKRALLKIDGKIAMSQDLKEIPSESGAPLAIGNYTSPSERYQFRGKIRNLKICEGEFLIRGDTN